MKKLSNAILDLATITKEWEKSKKKNAHGEMTQCINSSKIFHRHLLCIGNYILNKKF